MGSPSRQPRPGPWTLTPLEAGRLRGAVRDALLSFDRLAGTEHGGTPVGARCAEPAPPQPPGNPGLRQRVRLDPPTRPSVEEIASRINPITTPNQELSHDHRNDKPNRHARSTPVAA
jgi:hypothetical protein